MICTSKITPAQGTKKAGNCLNVDQTWIFVSHKISTNAFRCFIRQITGPLSSFFSHQENESYAG